MRTDAPPISLYDVFSEIPDPRQQRGKLYPLAAVLMMVATAMLCGARSLAAIADWGLNHNHLTPALGLGRKTKDEKRYRTPCTSELHTVLAALSAEVFEAALTRWILAQGVTDLDQRLVAIDGKTLRGSQGHQLPGVHLLAAYCRDVEAVIAQLAVPGPTNEHQTALELLKLIPLKGTLITGDTAFTQRDLCEAVVQGGGGLLPDRQGQPADSGGGHPGGLQPGFRRWTTTRLRGYLDWPGAQQVCLLERVRRIRGQRTEETVCAITSLGPEEASARRLLAITRGHWDIENPQSEDPRGDFLCAIGGPGYHRRRRPVGVGRVD